MVNELLAAAPLVLCTGGVVLETTGVVVLLAIGRRRVGSGELESSSSMVTFSFDLDFLLGTTLLLRLRLREVFVGNSSSDSSSPKARFL